MKSKLLSVKCFIVVLSLAILSCGSGAILGPTPTPVPSPTPTNIPTPTTDPLIQAMDAALAAWDRGDAQEAVAQYQSILKQTDDAAVRKDVIAGLIEIGRTTRQKAQMQWEGSSEESSRVQACDQFKQAMAAYQAVFDAQDRPAFEENPFYIDMAVVHIATADCAVSYQTPRMSNGEEITYLLDALATYPDRPEIKDVFVPTFERLLRNEVTSRYEDDPQAVTNLAEAIIAKVGDRPYDERNVSDMVMDRLLQGGPCKGNPSLSTIVGTSTNKRIYACSRQPAVVSAGLQAADPTEIYYVLSYKVDSGDSVKCSGYRTDTGTNFSYSYSGQYKEIYSLRDVHSGEEVASKTFVSTAPRCVFSTCSLNTLTNVATCSGGEATSTYDEEALVQWLKGQVQ